MNTTKLIISIAIVGIIVIGSGIYYVVNRQEVHIVPVPPQPAPQVQTPRATDYIGSYSTAKHAEFPGVSKPRTDAK